MHEIVVIDSSPELVEMFKYIFRDDNIVVLGFRSLTSSLPLLQKKTPDLLILDVFECNLYEQPELQQLRQNDRWRSLPILITSTAPSQVKNLELYGADDGLEKPFDLSDLKNKVYRLLGLN